VVKVTDGKNFAVSLPAGGQATFRGQKLEGAGPREILVAQGKVSQSSCTDLMKEAP
jgi:hypothetical protein